MALFGTTVHGAFLNRSANFETFPIAMLTLYRATTGENWNGIMWDMAIEEGDYNSAGVTCKSSEGNCGINFVAQIYFVSFYMIAVLVLMNLVLAAVLIAFNQSRKTHTSGLTSRMISLFRTEWNKFDPDGDSRVPRSQFRALLTGVAPIFDIEVTDERTTRLLKKIRDVGGEMRFSDVLYVLAFEKFGSSLGASKPAKQLQEKMVTQQARMDGDLDPSIKKVLPKLSEFQLDQMTADQLREQLRIRGFVREQKSRKE